MTGKGKITTLPNRRLKFMLTATGLWVALVFVMVGWWGALVYRQGDRIAELEKRAGVAAVQAETHWAKTQRMLLWESMTLLSLLLAITGALAWLYWRDSRRSRSLQAFFASVTHELKTPLTSIRLQSETIADHGSDPDLISRLLEDTSRLESQVERTLELARLEGGGDVLLQSLPVKSFLERLFSSIQKQFQDRVKLGKLELSSDLIFQADQTALQVVFKNLVENSIRYSGKPVVEVSLTGRAEGGKIKIHYEDNGKSTQPAPKHMGTLFQRGVNSQGAGVGLYLVKTLMLKMGGEASFSLEQGSGFRTDLLFLRGDIGGQA